MSVSVCSNLEQLHHRNGSKALSNGGELVAPRLPMERTSAFRKVLRVLFILEVLVIAAAQILAIGCAIWDLGRWAWGALSHV